MNTRRWPRYPFIAIVYAQDPDAKVAFTAKTSDLSLGGCHIDSANPLPQGTPINIEIVHKQTSFIAKGTVVYSRPGMGMGISFSQIEKDKKTILQGWLEDLQLACSPVAG